MYCITADMEYHEVVCGNIERTAEVHSQQKLLKRKVMQSLTLLICYMVNAWYQNRICINSRKVLPFLSTRDVSQGRRKYILGWYSPKPVIHSTILSSAVSITLCRSVWVPTFNQNKAVSIHHLSYHHHRPHPWVPSSIRMHSKHPYP